MNAIILNQLLPVFVWGIIAVVFTVTWWRERKLRSALLLAGSYGAGCFGFATLYLIDLARYPEYLVISDVAFIASAFLFPAALSLRFEVPIRLSIPLAIAALGIGGCAWFTIFEPNIEMRIKIVSFTTALLIAQGALLIWNVVRRPVDRLLRWLILTMSGVLLANCLFVHRMYDGMLTYTNIQDSIFLSVVNLAASIVSPSIAVVLFISYGQLLINELEKQTMTDPLSGLLNRRGFDSAAIELLEDSLRTATEVSLIVADVDGFKSINDAFGHQTGDRVIRQVGKVFMEYAGRADRAGRIGGDEFCLLLSGRSEAEAVEVADLVRRKIPAAGDAASLATNPPSASLGVAQYRPGEPFERLFARADAAMFLAKSAGRNRVVAASARYSQPLGTTPRPASLAGKAA